MNSGVSEKNHVWLIRSCAFLCGMAIMALEMVGVRLLEPYLGSTIYVWGAIIGIFLGALSIGYYAGGKFADRYPNFLALGLLIFLAAVWVFVVPIAALTIGSWASKSFTDPRWQTFFAAIILYAVPSILLGMVSPFLVRLAAKNINSVGQTAGSIYALSTFGSIVGTFLVSFVLTEYIGSIRLTFAIGAVLLFTAGICLFTARGAKIGNLLSMIILLICGWLIAQNANTKRVIATAFSRSSPNTFFRQQEKSTHLALRESAYHLINVFESNFNFDTFGMTAPDQRARYMVFNDQLESGCLTKNGAVKTPIETACGYVRLLTLGVLITQKSPQNLAIIGCGGGVGAIMFIDDYPTIKRFDVADIDAHVFELAGEFFNYPYPDRDNSVIRSHSVDGRQFLRNAPAKNWDYIILDAYTAGGRIPRHLISQEFFQLANEKLTDDGVVVVNIISDSENGRLFKSVLKTAQSVFKHIYVFPRDLISVSNIILVCSNHDGEKLSPTNLIRRFYDLQQQRLMQQPIASTVRNTPAMMPNLTNAPLLTDDFCPTDSMIATSK